MHYLPRVNLDIWCVLAITSVILTLFLNPRYERMLYENTMNQQKTSYELSLENDKSRYTVKVDEKCDYLENDQKV
ncbi:hypothetical protein DICVIV_03893 [Dictyocaulus viviparus]|uniref:Uncharacterized protein n=1 Tax=Dictyocaulus viviparus TaxID=29172 RepID=A0A0D8Y5U9_DICVI|nr:hypothetical protein DICVIV_03893 [Dictyocaulus viviparus]